MNTTHHIAQANWARRNAPLDDLKGFVDRLDEINALADGSPGFVWRFQTESGNATDFAAFGDDEVVFNFTVWESLETLKSFTYETDHAQLLRDRGKWFDTPDRAPMVLWWIPAGHIPRTEDAEARFRHLWEHGSTKEAFTFRDTFAPD